MRCLNYKPKVELELLSDPEMHTMFEKGILGGLSYIGHRHARANNKYMGKDHDPKKKSSYLMYWDANNLYGVPMCMPLAYKDFKWIDTKKRFRLKDNKYNLEMIQALCRVPAVEGGDHDGYIMEVDLKYPEHLHDKHRAFPLLPEQFKVKETEFSDYQQIAAEATGSKESTCPKLIPSLRDKKRYVLDIRMLRFAMEQGLELTKIHRCVQFTQKDYIRSYIEMNSSLRQKGVAAGNKFQKAYFKLMNNAIFGKSMENVRNRIDFEIITNKKRMESALRDPCLKSVHIFNRPKAADLIKAKFKNNEFEYASEDGVVGIEKRKKKVYLGKPIYAGLQILNLSKVVMYDFHYNHIMKAYPPDKVKLLFTDTDSLTYQIETEDVYDDMANHQHLKGKFDFSNYPKDHPLHNTKLESIPGYFKDELEGQIMTEFVGLRSKMYSYLKMGGKFANTHKGIKDSCNIQHDEYVTCLEEMKNTYASFNCLRSSKHNIEVKGITKKALCCFDDKTYILPDGIETLPWGHHKIKSHQQSRMFKSKAEVSQFVDKFKKNHIKMKAELKKLQQQPK